MPSSVTAVIHQLNGQGLEANAYLIVCREPLLIDVGTGTILAQLEKRLEAFLEGKRLSRLVLTHMHFDHTGGAARLAADTGARAFAYPPDSRAISEGDGELTCSGWLGERQAPMNVRDLKEREVIECGKMRLEVLHTPGHTSGSICLFDRPSGTLFSGDTVFTNGGVGRWDLPTGDHGSLVESLRMLAGLKVNAIYPGHGPYYEEDGSSHIRMGLEMARDFE
jgi:glyoxylase-like metal-dependent hydrolase (beta-lactamase superfamily II)